MRRISGEIPALSQVAPVQELINWSFGVFLEAYPMNSFNTISYLALVAATFAATYFVSHI